MVTNEMIFECERNSVVSREHVWEKGERSDYNVLHWRGRTLYDNLRTKFDVSHSEAFQVAVDLYGYNKSMHLN